MSVWSRIAARPVLSAIVTVLVAAGIASGVFFSRGSAGAAPAGVTTTTRLVSAVTGTVTESVSATGTLAPTDVEDVSFGSSAEVTSVKVAQGAKVTKGQVLGTIDPTALEAALATATATLAQAESTLASAQDSSSTSDVQLAQDKQGVTSARSALTAATTARAAATLRSPISGTVAEVDVAVGDTSSGSGTSATTGGGSATGGTSSDGAGTGTSSDPSAASSSTSSGDFVIIGTKAWTASASVDDTEVGLIAKGDQAQITTDNVTGTVFGTVSTVAVLATSSSGSASYPVTIAVTGSPSGLHDGASATISIVYKQLSNVLTVPTAAVHTDGTTKYVYRSASGKKVKTTVRAGLSSGGTTQITAGLSSGDQVDVETVVRTGGSTGTGAATTRTGNAPGGTGGFPGGGTGGFPGGTGGGR